MTLSDRSEGVGNRFYSVFAEEAFHSEQAFFPAKIQKIIETYYAEEFSSLFFCKTVVLFAV